MNQIGMPFDSEPTVYPRTARALARAGVAQAQFVAARTRFRELGFDLSYHSGRREFNLSGFAADTPAHCWESCWIGLGMIPAVVADPDAWIAGRPTPRAE